MKYLQKYYAVVTSIFIMVIYIVTLAPSVIQIDSGELATVQATLGIAHPTGYPLFTMIGYLLLKISLPMMVITKANLLAAVWCALGIFLFIKSAELILSNFQFTTTQKQIKKKKESKQANINLISLEQTVITFSAVLTAILLALSKTYWSQSTSVEVYSLQIFLFMLIIYASLKAFYKSTNNLYDWIWVGLAYALGFSNHMTTMLVIPFSAILFFQKEKFSKRSFAKILITIAAALPLLLLVYSYLPIRAATNPVLNWGNPIDSERILRHISGKQYQVWLFASFEAAGKQLKYFLSNFPDEFAYVGLIIGIIGFFFLLKQSKKLFTAFMVTFIFTVLYSINYDIVDIDSYFLLAYIMFGFFMLYGCVKLILYIRNKYSKIRNCQYSLALILLFPILLNLGAVNQSNIYSFEDYTKSILSSVEKNSILFTYQWDYLVSPSLYFQHVENYRADIAVIDKELLRRSWYFNQMKRNYPDIVKSIKPEITAFTESLKPFERDGNYDAGLLEQNYRTLMTSLVEENISKRNFYVGVELVQGEIARGELSLPQGYHLIPHMLMFKVVKDTGYIPAPDPNFTIRLPKEKNKYVQFIENVTGSMLAYRAAYELQFNKKDRARVYLNKARKDFPNYQIPLDILNSAGYN